MATSLFDTDCEDTELEVGCEVEVIEPKRKRLAVSCTAKSCKRKKKKGSVDETLGESSSKTHVRKALKKEEKAFISISLRELNAADILNKISDTVSGQSHIISYPDNAAFWEDLRTSGKEVVLTIIVHLLEVFSSLYESCGAKGKDKFMQFQLKWHHQCSNFLLSTPEVNYEDMNLDMTRIQERWIGYCLGKSVSVDTRNTVIISVCSAVHDHLLCHCNALQKSISDEVQPESTVHVHTDEDSVYYRFCGAALASMLHARYKKRNTCKPSQKGSVNREITILRGIKCTDKSHIPLELQYRDRGYMYFPTQDFIPFLREVDACITENANEKALERYGAKLVEITTQQLIANHELEDKFNFFLNSKLNFSEENKKLHVTELNSVYTELTRKLCNTRIQEFLDSHHQISVARKGSATTSGLNLRDNLLPLHINLKSTIH